MIDINEKFISQLLKYSSFTRGLVIEGLCRLEIRIDSYIAHYFCEEKLIDEFYSTFLKSGLVAIGFGKKIDIFLPLLQKKNPEMFASFGDKIKEELKEINRVRNVFAHQMIDTSDEGIELLKKRMIQFVQFKDEKEKTESFTEEKIIEINRLIDKYVYGLKKVKDTDLSSQISPFANE